MDAPKTLEQYEAALEAGVKTLSDLAGFVKELRQRAQTIKRKEEDYKRRQHDFSNQKRNFRRKLQKAAAAGVALAPAAPAAVAPAPAGPPRKRPSAEWSLFEVC